MNIVRKVEDAVNAENIPRGSVIYAGGNAATPVRLLQQLAKDSTIHGVSLLGVLFLGELQELFSEEACKRIEHRVIFNGPSSRNAVNTGKASYQFAVGRAAEHDCGLIAAKVPDQKNSPPMPGCAYSRLTLDKILFKVFLPADLDPAGGKPDADQKGAQVDNQPGFQIQCC